MPPLLVLCEPNTPDMQCMLLLYRYHFLARTHSTMLIAYYY